MKIMLIIPTLSFGGAERVMSELATEFALQKNAVQLVLLAKSNDCYKTHPTVQIHRLGFQNKGEFKKIIAEIETFWKLRRLLKREKPDAVLSFMEKYNVFVILATRGLGLKVFISDRSNPESAIPKHIDILRKLSYRYATGIIAQTSLAKEIIKRTTKNKNITVIPNPVKYVQRYPEIKRENIILNVGRLVPEKGQAYLLEAFKMLNNPKWRLIILGDGPLKNDLLGKAKQLQIDKQLIMPGAVSNVDEWLARASVFVLSSVSEGFPNSLLEAMAAGLPCVSFDCDAGPRDIIRNGVNGILVQTKNIQELADKINILINNPQLRSSMGKEAEKINEKLGISNVANAYIELFKRMIN